MEDGSSIQNVIDLNDLNEQLVDITGQPITIKTEIIEPLESTTSKSTTTLAAAMTATEVTVEDDETMTAVASASEEASEATKTVETPKEGTPGKKRQSFKPKVKQSTLSFRYQWLKMSVDFETRIEGFNFRPS